MGVKPEIELFDSGDITLMRDLLADGTLEGPTHRSFVMGVRYGFQPSPETVIYARDLLPHAQFTAIGIGKAAFTSATKARRIVEDLEGKIATFEEARQIVGLPARSSARAV